MSQFKPNADLNFTEKFINADLEFGKELNSNVAHATTTITLPRPQITAEAGYIVGLVQASATIELPLLTVTAQTSYDANVWRGLIKLGQHHSEMAKPLGVPVATRQEKSTKLAVRNKTNQEKAKYIQKYIYAKSQVSERINSHTKFSLETARFLQWTLAFGVKNLAFASVKARIKQELAKYIGQIYQSDFALMLKTRSRLEIKQELARYLDSAVIIWLNIAHWLDNGYRVGFEVARPVPYATKYRETGATNKPQYKPNADLNFTCKWVYPNADLNFGAKCQPQDKRKSTYDGVIIVSSDITLTNLDTGNEINIFSGNIGIDNKSYCWTLSADLAYFEKIEKGTLVELMLNGMVWRFIIDDVGTGKVFGETTVTITGKSQALILAYPFVDMRGYKYTQPTSAVQIVQAEINTVGGFELDWRLVDINGWNIPANVYSYTQYTPIQAIQDIANAGGGFVNAHPSEKRLIIKSDYPVPSWEWNSLKPDVVIPDVLYWNLSTSYSEKPNYNGVWVSSDKDKGIQGFIRRRGTDGGLTPDQVIHSVITEQSVAIHRGECELSQAGVTANYSMTTPLHPDIGILTPSDFITFIDEGEAKNAIVRGITISFNRSSEGKIDIQNQLKLEGKRWQ